MSHAGAILGIKELIIEEVKRRDSIEVWAKPTKRPSDKLRIKATNTRTIQHTRQGNQLMTLHLKMPKYHCLVVVAIFVLSLTVSVLVCVHPMPFN